MGEGGGGGLGLKRKGHLQLGTQEALWLLLGFQNSGGGPTRNKLPTRKKLGDAIAISNLKLSMTDPLTDRGRC